MERRTFLRLAAAGGALAAGAWTASPRDLHAVLAEGDDGTATPIDLPAGRFVVNRPVRVGPAGLRGAGRGRTVLVAGPGLSGPILVADDGAFTIAGLTVHGAVRTAVGARGSRFVTVG